MSSLALLSKKYHEECVQKKECIDGLQLKQTYKNKSKRLWYRGIGCEATQIQGMQGMHLKTQFVDPAQSFSLQSLGL